MRNWTRGWVMGNPQIRLHRRRRGGRIGVGSVIVGVVGVAVGFGLGVVVYAGGGSDASECGGEGVAVGGVSEGFLLAYEFVAEEVEEVLVEGLLAVAGGSDVVGEFEGASFEDVLGGDGAASEDFGGGSA